MEVALEAAVLLARNSGTAGYWLLCVPLKQSNSRALRLDDGSSLVSRLVNASFAARACSRNIIRVLPIATRRIHCNNNSKIPESTLSYCIVIGTLSPRVRGYANCFITNKPATTPAIESHAQAESSRSPSIERELVISLLYHARVHENDRKCRPSSCSCREIATYATR